MGTGAAAALVRRVARGGWAVLRASALCVWTGLVAVGAASGAVQPRQIDGEEGDSGESPARSAAIGPFEGHPERMPPPWPRSDAEHWLREQLEEIGNGRRGTGRGAARRRSKS